MFQDAAGMPRSVIPNLEMRSSFPKGFPYDGQTEKEPQQTIHGLLLDLGTGFPPGQSTLGNAHLRRDFAFA